MADVVSYGTPRGRWVLAATVLGSGIGFLDATVVNIALPEIGRDLGADLSGLQWTVNAYLLTLASLILLGGALGDRYGRRRVFVIGVTWFALASLACAVAPNVPVLIAARALQGIGGSLLTPGSLAIISASFQPDDRGRAIGAWSALAGVASAAGPFVGGYLIDAASWRWIFLINLPLAAAVVAIAARHVPESRDELAAGTPLDVAGAATATLALASVTYALVEQAVLPAVVALVAGGAFALVERRSPAPLLPRGIFASRQFRAANLVTFLVYAALGGVFFFLVVALQLVLSYSPLEAGVASLPITVLLLALSPRAGAFALRVGPRLPLTVGPLIVAAGIVMLARTGPGDSYIGTILPALLVFGVGLACVVSPVTATALASVEDRHAGMASAVNNAVSRVAQLLAVAILPVAAGLRGDDYQSPAAFSDAFQTGMYIAAALSAAGGIAAAFTVSDDVLRRAPEPEVRRHCGIEGAPARRHTDAEPPAVAA